MLTFYSCYFLDVSGFLLVCAVPQQQSCGEPQPRVLQAVPPSRYSTDQVPQVKYGVRSPKTIWAPCAQLYSLAETLQPPPPAFGLI